MAQRYWMKIQKLAYKVYDSFQHKFDIHHFTKDDWIQEIYFIIIRCQEKFKNNNESNASFETYVYAAFSNHLFNLKKKHIFKPPNPCLQKCPFWVVSHKRCVSKNIQSHCIAYCRYQEMLHDNIYKERAVNMRLHEAVQLPEGHLDELAEDMCFFAEKNGYDSLAVSSIIYSVINGDKCNGLTYKRAIPAIRKYIKECGIS